MKKHANIALFVAHEGCPQKCSFCNQRIIAAQTERLTVADIGDAVETAVKSGNRGAQLAFFGGSFTAIERDYMLSLLEEAYKYVKSEDVSSIRISTRPDFIDDEILSLLKQYGVLSIELGAQSMDDNVLKLNDRGHTAEDVVTASELIKKRGFELGLQMMTGLYGDTDEKAIETANKIAALKPDTVRIYPTVVLKGTKLDKLYRLGIYKPQSLDSAINLCSKLLMIFYKNDIPVIRLGLHSGGNVAEGYVAGVYHPAFGELCKNAIYRDILSNAFKDKDDGTYSVECAEGELSKVIGQNRSNIKDLQASGRICTVRENPLLDKYDITITEKEDK